jgi:hypothetical protein
MAKVLMCWFETSHVSVRSQNCRYLQEIMCLAHWARICIVVLVAGTSGPIKQAKSLLVIEPFAAAIPSASRLSVLNKYESRAFWQTPEWRAGVPSLEDFLRPSRGSEMATQGAELRDAVDVSSLINDKQQASKTGTARLIIGLLAALAFLRDRLLRGSYCRECYDLRGHLSIASRNLARARDYWSTTAGTTINAADEEISSHRKQFRSYTEQVRILSSAIDDHQRTRHAKLAHCRQYEEPRERLLIASQNEIEILSAATGDHRRACHTKRSFCRVCDDLEEHRLIASRNLALAGDSLGACVAMKSIGDPELGRLEYQVEVLAKAVACHRLVHQSAYQQRRLETHMPATPGAPAKICCNKGSPADGFGLFSGRLNVRRRDAFVKEDR